MSDRPLGGEADQSERGRARRPSPEGDALLVARTRLGLTQPAFAERLSERLGRRVDRTQVAKWEAGVYRPRAAVMLAAAALVSMPLHELMTEGTALQGLRGDRIGAGWSSHRRPEPRGGAVDLSAPREQVLALLDLGFSLPEAIDLVRRQGGTGGGSPEPAGR